MILIPTLGLNASFLLEEEHEQSKKEKYLLTILGYVADHIRIYK